MTRHRPTTWVVWLAAVALAWPTAATRQRFEAGDWSQRLEALDPLDPMSYFTLAEEIADAAADEHHRGLARHLFALSGALDPIRLGRSACLALADLENHGYARRRLLALASLLDQRGGPVAWPVTWQTADIDRAAALAVAEALSEYRKGRGARALNALQIAGARELIERYGHVFRGGSDRFLEDCRLYRGGSRRPALSESDLVRMLRFEIARLAGGDREWSGDLLLTDRRALIEVDPDRLAETFGIDASRPYYRDGGWRNGG